MTVILASIKWDFIWQRHQALAVAAAQRTPVVFVESQPRSTRQLAHWFRAQLRARLNAGPNLRRGVRQGRADVGVPPPANPRPDGVRLVAASVLALLLPQVWAYLTARAIARKHPGAVADVIVYAPSRAYIALGSRLERIYPQARVTYDAVVDWAEVPAGWWPPPSPRRAETAMPRHWKVTSDSQSLADVLAVAMQRPVDVVLPAADPAFTAHRWDDARRDPGTIGWFGVVRDETDVDLLCHAARSGLQVETVGPVETAALRAQLEQAGVLVRPAVRPDELPEAMAHWSGVLCAYRGARAGTITPAKIFNALSGFTVFTRGLRLPAELQRWVIDLPAGDDDAVVAIRRAMATPPSLPTQRSQTWSDRLDQIVGGSHG